MRFKTMRDVLNRVVLFHQQLRDLYLRLGNISERERIKLLLDYMARHEEHLQESLARYVDGASNGILDTCFKYVPSSTILKNCDEIKLDADMSVDEIIQTAIKFDDCLVHFYKTMAENSVSERVKDVFLNLAEMEKRAKFDFARNALEIYDF